MNQPPTLRAIPRREFLRRAGQAGLLLAGSAGLGLGLHDPDPPSPEAGRGLAGLPDFSRPDRAGLLAIAKGSDRARCLAAALSALGGLAEFIRPGERVLIKVNAAFASPPALGATSDPGLLKALVAACRQAGAAEVLVSDNPIQDPAASFDFSGLAAACRESGASLVLPTPGQFRPVSLPGGRLIRDWPLLHGPLARADRLIGLCPVKDHHRSLASLAMKNWYGLLGGNRAVFHQEIFEIIKELALLVKPTLVVLDGVMSMVKNGPTGGSAGDLKPTGTLIVASDQVAADAAAAGLLGLDPREVPFIGLAARAGAGQADFESLKPQRVEA